jgi:glucosylceramidase
MKTLTRYLTDRDSGARLRADKPVSFSPAASLSDFHSTGLHSIRIDPRVRYQTHEGFGGAFTEAAATTLLKLSAAKQEEILRAYFDPATGLGYNLCRTHINSCDFALGNYAYVEQPGDFDLKSFSLDRDRKALIPMIQRALKIAGSDLKLFASPWSPPAWMKTTGEMNHGGKLLPKYRKVWAAYYVRFIHELEKHGGKIWGLTVQNEPDATQTWDSCLYTAEEERDFVRDYLGPALHRAKLQRIRLLVWDHNRDRLYQRAKVVYDDPKAAKYVWGAAFHWYMGDNFENVRYLHDVYPQKNLLFTEGCVGTPQISWDLAEKYARSIIADLNRWTNGWIDWNMILNEAGGPNHTGGYCSAPINYDRALRRVHFRPSFYYLGHFSRFIKPGARRVIAASTSDHLETVAARNPDGSLAVVALNRTAVPITFKLVADDQTAPFELPPHAIATFVIPPAPNPSKRK